MLLGLPTWCLPALLCSLLTPSGPGAAKLVLAGSLKPYMVLPRDDHDHDDSDTDSDDDDDKSSTHHHGSSTTTASGRTTVGSGSSATVTGSASKPTGTASPSGNKITSHGAVAGIVIACLLCILLLICLTCWCRRRRRTRAQHQAQAAAILAAAPEMKEHAHSSTPLLVQQQHPPNPRTPVDTVPGPLYFSDSPGRHETSQDMRNIAPGTDDGRPLPNPYDGDTPPQPPPRDLLLASPTSPTGPTAWSYSTSAPDASNSTSTSVSSRMSRRVSAAPSAWTHEELHSDAASASSAAPLLARGDTQTSRLTASSSLHEEMAGYQKRLEAHHRKESEDAILLEHGIGAGASVPADPPPVYSAAVDM